MKASGPIFFLIFDAKIARSGNVINTLPGRIGNQHGTIFRLVRLHDPCFAHEHRAHDGAWHVLVFTLGPFTPDDVVDLGKRGEIIERPPHKVADVSQLALYRKDFAFIEKLIQFGLRLDKLRVGRLRIVGVVLANAMFMLLRRRDLPSVPHLNREKMRD